MSLQKSSIAWMLGSSLIACNVSRSHFELLRCHSFVRSRISVIGRMKVHFHFISLLKRLTYPLSSKSLIVIFKHYSLVFVVDIGIFFISTRSMLAGTCRLIETYSKFEFVPTSSFLNTSPRARDPTFALYSGSS